MTAAVAATAITTTASATTVTAAAAKEIHYNASTEETVDGVKFQWCLCILCRLECCTASVVWYS
jgi:hypothetical protein